MAGSDFQTDRPIVLVGLMGAGKRPSAVALAVRLGLPFVVTRTRRWPGRLASRSRRCSAGSASPPSANASATRSRGSPRARRG